MENERDTREDLSYDWRNLGCAQVAGQYLKQGKEGVPLAKKALELILEDCEIKDPWIVKTVTDPKIVAKTVQSQLETYSQCKKNETVGEFLDYHKSTLENYLGDKLGKVDEELNPFKDRKLGDIDKEIAKAEHIIEGKEHGLSSDNDVKEAEKIIEKYKKLDSTIKILEQAYMSKFQVRVEDGFVKEALNNMYSPDEESTE